MNTSQSYFNFNQNSTNFVHSHNEGYDIFKCDTLTKKISKKFIGGLSYISVLYQCNIMCLIGSGANINYSPNKILLWDDFEQKIIKILTFKSPIKKIKMYKDMIVICLSDTVYLYTFYDLVLKNFINIPNNDNGIIDIQKLYDTYVLATLDNKKGSFQIQKLNHPDIKTISGHISQVGYIVFSKDGKYLATCSIKGTVIRIWDVNTFSKLQELRRGTEPATMTCICFSPSNKFLACSSTRGTIHVFKLNISNTENKSSTYKNILNIPGYLVSEWSFSQFKLKHEKCSLTFSPDETKLYILIDNGFFYKVSYLNVDKSNNSQLEKKFNFRN